MMSHFECDDAENLKEYVGCTIECNYDEGVCGWLNLTQLILIQSFNYDFDLTQRRDPVTPAEPGQIMEHGSPQN